MNQTGGLKKRRKRNITKVSGIGLVPYDENADTFDGKQFLYNNNDTNEFVTNDGYETRINISGIHSSRNSTRVTRLATFSSVETETFGIFGLPNLVNENWRNNKTITTKTFDINEPEISSHKRRYYLNQKTMTRLRQLLIFGLTSGTFPWIFNKKTHTIDKLGNKGCKIWYYYWVVNTIQTFLLFFYQIYSFFERQPPTIPGVQKTYRGAFMQSVSIFWYTFALVGNFNMYLFKEDIRQYINYLLAINKKLVDRFVINADDSVDSGSVLMKISIPSNTCQVFISVSFFLSRPHQPWFLYSYIFASEIPWYLLIPGAVQDYMLAGQVITSYMLLSWIIVAHCNSVSFWLRETHNHSDSEFTVDELRTPTHAMHTYRTLQVLSQIFNDCMSPITIPMVKMHSWLGFIPTGYVLIRSMNHLFFDDFPGILTYPMGVLDVSTGSYSILTVGAEMFDLSVSCIDSWGQTKQKDFRRVLMSCPALKVKVGHFYPITRSTTITFCKSAVDVVIDCIITLP